MAIQNHPQIQAAQNEVNFANQQIVESRAAYYPTVTGDLTGSQGNNLARIGAGDLSASRLFNRFGQGVMVRQLITDSGRTPNLVGSRACRPSHGAKRPSHALRRAAPGESLLFRRAARSSRGQGGGANCRRASDAERSGDRTGQEQLKSQLDVSFAEVNVSEAKLLLIRAQDGVQQALAELGRAMGSDQPANYQLVDEPLPPARLPPPTTGRPGSQQSPGTGQPALFARRRLQVRRGRKGSLASHGERGRGGRVHSVHQHTFLRVPIPAEYEGVAANVSIPVFNGHLFSARREAAAQRAMESDQRLRDEQQRISRDVRVAWASANDAYQRIDVTAQFLRQAALALDLAQGRYNLGLSSIVELTQAQLNLTEAEIENLNAKYDYQTQYSALQYTIGLLTIGRD